MVPPPPPTPPKPTAFGVQLKTTGIPSRPTDHSIQAQVETELIGSVKDRLKQFDLKAGQQQQIRPRSKSSDRRPIRPAKPTGILSDPRPQQLAKNLGQVDSAKGPASSTPLVHQTRSLFETTGNRCDFSEIPRSTQTTSRSSFNLKDIRAKLENEIHLGPVEPKTAHHVTIEPGHQRHTEPQRKTSGPARPPPPKVQQSPPQAEPFAVVIYEFVGQQSDEINSRVDDQITLQKSIDQDWVLGVNRRTKQQGIIPWNHLSVKIPLSSGPVRPPPPPPVVNKPQLSVPPLSQSVQPKIAAKIPVVQRSVPTKPPPPKPLPRYEEPPGDADSGVESFSEGPRCYTLHDFNSGESGDLAFSQGEIIRLLSKVNKDWFEGESSDGRKGIFPATFVQIVEELPNANVSPPCSPPSGLQTNAAGDNVVTALYDFDGCAAGDLTFKAHDKIKVISQVDAEWLYGQVVGRPHLPGGIFPVNFVDRLPSSVCQTPSKIKSSAAVASKKSASKFSTGSLEGKCAVALYDFTGSHTNELSFEAGDQIIIEREIDADWLEGHVVLNLSTKRQLPTGIFPRAFVKLDS